MTPILAAAVKTRDRIPPWLIVVVGWAAAGLVTYYGTLNAMDQRVTTVTIREQDHYEQLHSDLLEVKADVKDLKARGK